MKAKRSTGRRRVVTQYSDEDRKRLIEEQVQSGLTKKGFCEQRGVNLGTFYGWSKSKSRRALKPKRPFAEVQVATPAPAAVEVLLPNGTRVGIRHECKRDELVALVRGIAGYRQERHKC